MARVTTRWTPFTTTPQVATESFPEDIDVRNAEMTSRMDEIDNIGQEIDAVGQEVNIKADEAAISAAESANNAIIAQSASNYQGDYKATYPNGDATGYAKGDAVSYTDGYNYVSKVDNNTVEPTTLTNTAEWNFLETVNPNNYYLKTEVYTKAEVVQLIANAEPQNVIKMWYGLSSNPPAGWAICNGSNGTPDFRDRVPVGAGGLYPLGSTGGNKDAVVVSHNHSATTNSAGAHVHGYNRAEGYTGGLGEYAGNGNPGTGTAIKNTYNAGSHSHSVVVNSSGESGVDKNMQPYLGTHFIIKL